MSDQNLQRTIERLNQDGFYVCDLHDDHPDSRRIKGPYIAIRRNTTGKRIYAIAFNEADAWQEFLGYFNH